MENKKKRPELKSERRVIFSSRTFNSKLFLKLTGDFIHPSIICVQILKYEKENRKIGEIERALPWLKTFSDFMNFINSSLFKFCFEFNSYIVRKNIRIFFYS